MRENLTRTCNALTDYLYPTALRLPVPREAALDDLGDEATVALYDWLDGLLEFTRRS